MGYGVLRDKGTSPITYQGPLMTAVAGVWNDRSWWKFHLDVVTSFGYYENSIAPRFNFSTFDISNTVKFRAMRCIPDPFFFPESIWIGIGASNFLDVSVNTNYENAATGVSEFFGPELLLKAESNLGFYSNWFLIGEVSFMPVAAMLRPGYAYMDNYTASQPVHTALFDGYEWNTKLFAGLSTEIGFRYRMENDNQLYLSYRWDYHSSGSKGSWRFDHAMHGIYVDLIVHLKRKWIKMN